MTSKKQELYDPAEGSSVNIPVLQDDSGHHFFLRANVVIVIALFVLTMLALTWGYFNLATKISENKKHPTPTPITGSQNQSPSPSCRPRPSCLDSIPKCLIAETSDMCPPSLSPSPTPEQVFCTQEAKLCPDGVSYVGRSGPNCDFAACPGERCGGFIQDAPTCSTGYHCELNQQNPDIGGFCVKD